MNSRERALTALNYEESDRVPFDLGGMAQSGIHNVAYKNLRDFLGLPEKKVDILNMITQAAPDCVKTFSFSFFFVQFCAKYDII